MTDESREPPFLIIAGIPITEGPDLIYAAAVMIHRAEFLAPILGEEGRACCRCGKIVATSDVRGWTSFQTLVLDGTFAGFAYLYHCTDCPPEKLLPEIKATGTWPVETDEWKFVQGELKPNE